MAVRRTHALWAPFLLALAPLAFLTAKYFFVCDDAFISFRYARNLASGAGLCFNPGEAPPVEGYSNLLWVLVLAVVELCGGAPNVWAPALSALCAALLLWLVLRFVRDRLHADLVQSAAVGLFLGTLPAMGLWATSGLASMPLALFVFACFERLTGSPRPRGVSAGVFAVLATTIRADGVAWVAMVVVAAFVTAPAERRRELLRRGLFPVVALTAVAFLSQEAFRLVYFGESVPNTAKAKIGLSAEGLQRGALYSLSWLLFLPSIPLAVAAAVIGRGLPREVLWSSLAIVAGGLAYATLVGGDFMPLGRFLVPALPFAALFVAGAWRAGSGGLRLGPLAFVAAALALNVAAARDRNVVPDPVLRAAHFRLDRTWMTELSRWREMRRSTERHTLCGRALATFVRPGESIVLGAIGAIGYYSDLRVFDVHGLVSPRVLDATTPLPHHSPGHDFEVSARFFLDRDPTYFDAWIGRPGGKIPKRAAEMLEAGFGVLESHALGEQPDDDRLFVVRNRSAGVSAPASRGSGPRGS